MKHLILIRGLPGSGKTTLAKYYQSSSAYRHYEADMFFENPETGKYEFVPEKVPEAHQWCQRKAEACMYFGFPVVVSNTFVQNWMMQPYIDMAIKHGYSIVIIETKGEYGSVHNVPEESLKRMKAKWEELNEDLSKYKYMG